MKIISKTRDYYDSVAKPSMVDNTIVFNRETKIIPIKTNICAPRIDSWAGLSRCTYNGQRHPAASWYASMLEGHICVAPLYFCGEMYWMLSIDDDSHLIDGLTGRCGIRNVVCYDYTKDKNKVLETATSLSQKYMETIENKAARKEYSSFSTMKIYKWQQERAIGWIDEISNIKFDELAREHHTPILVVVENGEFKKGYRETVVVANHNIGELGFARVQDPYTCFQNIGSYLSGVLGSNGNPMVKLRDIDILDKHGFDRRISFRHRKDE